MTQQQPDIDVGLIQRVIFGPISDHDYLQMMARISWLERVRFRRSMRFLSGLARRLEPGG